jgi:hypothetical protein
MNLERRGKHFSRDSTDCYQEVDLPAGLGNRDKEIEEIRQHIQITLYAKGNGCYY